MMRYDVGGLGFCIISVSVGKQYGSRVGECLV